MPDVDAGIVRAPTWEHAEALEFLSYFETMFLIDDSSNMKRQWSDVEAIIRAVAPTCLKYDQNGIDIYFTNHTPLLYFPGMSVRKSGYNNVGRAHNDDGGKKKESAQGIVSSVRPGGTCRLGARLDALLTWYVGRLKADPKFAPLNLVVVTAGVSADDYQAPLVRAARELDALRAPAHQLGVMLFQLGDDEGVRAAFEHADDHMGRAAGTRDIVDTVAWRGWPASFGADDMVKAILGSVSRHMDAAKPALDGAAKPSRRETDLE
ncbi:hypothetical protein GGR56DRAFT_652832 [Xylariaceae sp. FL0804]|nr:hypothetical protein GGR56DRAFT_652832 [Xylariaceae sp. FL0804]